MLDARSASAHSQHQPQRPYPSCRSEGSSVICPCLRLYPSLTRYWVFLTGVTRFFCLLAWHCPPLTHDRSLSLLAFILICAHSTHFTHTSVDTRRYYCPWSGVTIKPVPTQSSLTVSCHMPIFKCPLSIAVSRKYARRAHT